MTGPDPAGAPVAITAIDLAKVDPCPGGCGTLVRRMTVPVSGSGLDSSPSGPWWCSACLQAKVVAAVASIGRRTESTLL